MASNQPGRRQNEAVEKGGSGFLAYPPFTTNAVEPQTHHGFNPNPQVNRVNQGNAGNGGFVGQGGHPGNQHHQEAPKEDAFTFVDCKNRHINIKRFSYEVVNCLCPRCQGRTKTLFLCDFRGDQNDWQILKAVRSVFSRHGRLESVKFVEGADGQPKKPLCIFVRYDFLPPQPPIVCPSNSLMIASMPRRKPWRRRRPSIVQSCLEFLRG